MFRRLNQFWRICTTGLSFILFGLGGLLLALVIFPTIVFFEQDELVRQRKAQRLIQRTFKLFLWFIRWTRTVGIEWVGTEELKNDRGCLIVANHPSLLDYVMIASRLPQCDCIVKSAVVNNPYMRGIVKAAGYVSNADVSQFTDECADRLKKGHVLLVFPEGTRTTPGKKPNLVRGAAQIATHAGVDLRLIHVTVSPSFLTKQHKWYNAPETKPVFRIEVKGKIEIEPFLSGAKSVNAAARRLNRHLDEVLFPGEERTRLER